MASNKRSLLLEDQPAASSSKEVESEEEETEVSSVEGYVSDSVDYDESPKQPKARTLTTIVEPTKHTTSATTSAPRKTRVAGKRPLEAEKEEKVKDSKRKKKKKKKKKVGDGDKDENRNEQRGGGGGGLEKKKPFERIWSKDDEIVILKCMRDNVKNGIDHPASKLDELHDSIMKSIHVDFSIDQLSNKIRKLKRKYLNNCKKGKDGEDPSFSNTHDLKCYKLMKKIWGGRQAEGIAFKETKNKKGNDALNNGNEDSTLTNGKRSSSSKPTVKSGAASSSNQETAANLALYPFFNDSVKSNMKLLGLGECFLKEGLSKIGDSKAKEFEEKSKELHMAELEIHAKRAKLQKEQLQALFEGPDY